MAGKMRLRVSQEHVEPFWMFVDREESPLIVNVQKQIEQRLENANVASLWLDDCLLPADETSELLRDNDMVHVIVTKCGTGSSPQQKKNRKRKHSNEGAECPGLDLQISSALNATKIKKIMKEKFDSDGHKVDKENEKKKKEKNVAELVDEGLVDEELVANKKGGRKAQKEKRKKKKKNVVDLCMDNDLALGHPSPGGVKQTSETQIGPETPAGMETTEMAGKASSTAVDEATNSSVPEKRNRRRRKKKKTNSRDQSKAVEDSAKTPTVTKKTPVQMRVPKWQQPQNKKIVFSSESDEETASKTPISSHETADKSQDASLGQLGTSDNNTSFSECYPVTPSLNMSKGNKDGAGDAVSSDVGRTELNSTSSVSESEMNIPEDVNGTASADTSVVARIKALAQNGDSEWYRDQSHQKVALPNLAEYLKMSPEERGVTVSPYVTARRMSNGAMLYTRSPVAPGSDWNSASSSSSPFKEPTSQAPAKASPRSLSSKQQQQLQTVNSNRSIVIENPCSAPSVRFSDTERNGDWPVKMGKSFADSWETIVLTPVPQDYSIFPDLTTSPKVGDNIAYKVLEMGEDYTPGISDFKEAEVLMYDPSTQNVTLRLLHANTKKRVPGKFDIHDETPEEEEVTVELSSMFEPKLMSSL